MSLTEEFQTVINMASEYLQQINQGNTVESVMNNDICYDFAYEIDNLKYDGIKDFNSNGEFDHKDGPDQIRQLIQPLESLYSTMKEREPIWDKYSNSNNLTLLETLNVLEILLYRLRLSITFQDLIQQMELSRKEFADMLGNTCSQSVITKYINCSMSLPNRNTILNYSQALRIDPAQLSSGRFPDLSIEEPFDRGLEELNEGVSDLDIVQLKKVIEYARNLDIN